MNVRLTLEMEGTSEEVSAWLNRLGGQAGAADGAGSASETFAPAIADQLVRRITDDARRALRFIAENAPEVSWEDVQEHLGVTGIQIGGVMASFGFAENAGITRPYSKDRARRVYTIDPHTAEVVLEALDRFENGSG